MHICIYFPIIQSIFKKPRLKRSHFVRALDNLFIRSLWTAEISQDLEHREDSMRDGLLEILRENKMIDGGNDKCHVSSHTPEPYYLLILHRSVN